MNAGDVIHQYKRDHRLTDEQIADLITEELQRRDAPPRSVARTTVLNWREGLYNVNVFMMEWLAENAENEVIKALAGDVIGAMAANGDGE